MGVRAEGFGTSGGGFVCVVWGCPRRGSARATNLKPTDAVVTGDIADSPVTDRNDREALHALKCAQYQDSVPGSFLPSALGVTLRGWQWCAECLVRICDMRQLEDAYGPAWACSLCVSAAQGRQAAAEAAHATPGSRTYTKCISSPGRAPIPIASVQDIFEV
jgi:hypothetical protein